MTTWGDILCKAGCEIVFELGDDVAGEIEWIEPIKSEWKGARRWRAWRVANGKKYDITHARYPDGIWPDRDDARGKLEAAVATGVKP